MRFLKQSTSVDVPIGPFLDSTDGVTAETLLTITQPDVRLKKNAGAWAQKAAAQTLTHEENGNYEVTLDATDTDTLGLLRLHVAESGALPVWEDFMVMPANVWDSLFGADLLQVDATQLLGTAYATPTVAGVQEVDLTHVAGATTNVAALATNVDAILTDTADMQPKLGTPAGASISADIAAIEAQTDDIGAAGAGLTALATQASVNTIDDFLDTEIAAIKAKTDNLPASPAAAGDAMALTSAERNSTADAIFLRTLGTEAYAADGVVPTFAQAIFQLLSMLGEFSIAGTTITCKKLDGSTTSMTFTLDNATTPTSRTRAT